MESEKRRSSVLKFLPLVQILAVRGQENEEGTGEEDEEDHRVGEGAGVKDKAEKERQRNGASKIERVLDGVLDHNGRRAKMQRKEGPRRRKGGEMVQAARKIRKQTEILLMMHQSLLHRMCCLRQRMFQLLS